MISSFCEDHANVEVISDITKYITHAYCWMQGKDFACKLMTRDTKSMKQTRCPTLATVFSPAIHNAKRSKKIEAVGDDDIDIEVEYLLFDAATSNSSTEEKGCIDDNILLEIEV